MLARLLAVFLLIGVLLTSSAAAQQITQSGDKASQSEPALDDHSGRQVDPERLFVGIVEQLGFENEPRIESIPPGKSRAFIGLDDSTAKKLQSMLNVVYTCSVSEYRNDTIDHATVECFHARDATAAASVLKGVSDVMASELEFLQEQGPPEDFRVDAVTQTSFTAFDGMMVRLEYTDLAAQHPVHCVRATARCDDYVVQISMQTTRLNSGQKFENALDGLCRRFKGGDIYVQGAEYAMRQALLSVETLLGAGHWRVNPKPLKEDEIAAVLRSEVKPELRFDKGFERAEAILFRNSGVPSRMREIVVIILLEYDSNESAQAQAEPFGRSLDVMIERFGVVPESLGAVTQHELDSGESFWTVSGEVNYMGRLAPFTISSIQCGKRIACWNELRNPIGRDRAPALANLLFEK